MKDANLERTVMDPIRIYIVVPDYNARKLPTGEV